jgi:hypothetical protein
MGKDHKRSFKKRHVSKSNRPANSKPSKTEQTQKPKEPQITTPPIKEEKSGGRKPLWRKVVAGVVSLVLLLIGYDGLWPKVVIEPSSAVDSGVTIYQFTLANQPCYPVKIISVDMSPINLTLTNQAGWSMEFSNVTFHYPYTNKNVQIGGRDSITIKIGNIFRFTPLSNKLKEGTKMVARITYQMPLIKIEKTDSALFEAAQDSNGNPMWIKKPIGQFINYKPTTVFIMFPKD